MTDAAPSRSVAIEQLLVVGRPERAEQLAREVLATNPEQALVLCLLGRAQLAQNRAAEALGSAHRAVALTPGHPEPHRFLAVAAAANGDHSTAFRALDTTVALAPLSPAAHQTRAQVLLGLGRHESALDAAREAVRLAPDHVGTAVVLAACLLANRRRDEAAAEADRALRIDPDDVAAHDLRAQLAVLRGEPDAAERTRRVLSMRPTDADTRRSVVNSLQSQYRVARLLVRLEVWISDLPAVSRWAVRLAPFVYLRVLTAVHTGVAFLLAVPAVIYVLATWATGPTTMLLLMGRTETRRFLDPRQRRAAVGFGVLLLLGTTTAVVAVIVGLSSLLIATLAFGVWALAVGQFSDIGSVRIRRVVAGVGAVAGLLIAGAGGAAAALHDRQIFGSGSAVAMLLGLVALYLATAGVAGLGARRSTSRTRSRTPRDVVRRR